MLKPPGLKSSGLYISSFKIGPIDVLKNMFQNMFENSSKFQKRSKVLFFIFLDSNWANFSLKIGYHL